MSTPAAGSPLSTWPQRTDSGSVTAGTSGVATPGEVAHSGPPTPGDAVGGFGRTQHGMFGVRDGGDTSGFGGLVRDPFVSPAAERPYGSYFDEVVDSLIAALQGVSIAASASERGAERLDNTGVSIAASASERGAERLESAAAKAITKVVVDRGDLMLHVEVDRLALVAETLRNDPNLRFELLSNVSGVDYLGAQNRLHVVYQLRSMTYRRRIGLEVAVPIENPRVPSLTAIYPTADWQERETWDMFGIVFDGHPALTRVLMPDDWDGHPQRKDYPLGGVAVEYKGATIPPPDERRAYR